MPGMRVPATAVDDHGLGGVDLLAPDNYLLDAIAPDKDGAREALSPGAVEDLHVVLKRTAPPPCFPIIANLPCQRRDPPR